MSSELAPAQVEQVSIEVTSPDDVPVLHGVLNRHLDPEVLSDQLERLGWTPEAEIEELVTIAQSAEKVTARISAIKELRNRIVDGARLGGLLVDLRAQRHSTDADGNAQTETMQTTKVVGQIGQRLDLADQTGNSDERDRPTERLGSPSSDADDRGPGEGQPEPRPDAEGGGPDETERPGSESESTGDGDSPSSGRPESGYGGLATG